jgi:hypothetical protein
MPPTPRCPFRHLHVLSLAILMCMGAAPIAAEPQAGTAPQIHTGGESGAYHRNFCPPLAKALIDAGNPHVCAPSSGSFDNMRRIAVEPRDFGFAQRDVMTLERTKFDDGRAFQTVRVDDVRECLFAVARNPELKTFGDIAARAEELRFILPPETSGSTGTFRYLQSIDMDLAHASSVRHAGDVDEAIRLALAADDTVAVFVQFPDPDNPRFQLINRLGGHFIPVIDRNILAARIDDRAVYFAQATEVTDARWTKKGKKVVTACTPLVVFTGAEDRITDPDVSAVHKKAVELLRTLPGETIRPNKGFLAGILKRTRELSATAVGKLIDVSDAAREKAKPLIDRAKEATSKALEGSKPHIDKAKQSGAKTLEKAKEAVKELIEPAPDHGPKPE